MTTKEKILKEFDEEFLVEQQSDFDQPVMVIKRIENGSNTPIYSTKRAQVKSFLSSSLDTYGKEQREQGYKDGSQEGMRLGLKLNPVEISNEMLDDAFNNALDEAIAAVEKYQCDFAPVEELRGRKMTEANIKELMRRVADARQNVVAKEALSTLNALRKK